MSEDNGSVEQNQSVAEKAQAIKEKATRLQQIGRNVLHAAKTVLHSVIAVVINPWFWIITAVVALIFIIIMATMAAYSTIGRNDMGDDCGTGMSSTVNLHSGDNLTEEQVKENAFMIMSWLMTTTFESNGGKPFSKEQAAAMVANMHEETYEEPFNPSLIQDKKLPPTATNEQVAALIAGHTSSNAGAVGMFQHRQGRAAKMLEIATSSGRQWNDAAVQLEHFKYELDTPGQRGDYLKRSKFYESGHTVREYVQFANSYFGSFRYVVGVEGAGNGSNTEGIDPALGGVAGESAVTYAEMLVKEFSGSHGTGKGGNSHCVSSGSADYAGIIELAKSLSNGQVGRDYHCSKGANAAYLEARARQVQAGLGIGTSNTCGGDYADCGKFVGTVVNNLLDKAFPPAGTWSQLPYMQNSPDWQEITSPAELETGDVLITKAGYTGHVLMYLGDVDGEPRRVVQASLNGSNSQLPRIGSYEGQFGNSFTETYTVNGQYRQYVAFRYTGTPNGLSS